MRLLGLHMGSLGGASHVNSTKRKGAPVHLSGDGQPTLTSSPEHMSEDEDSSEDEEYSTSSVLTQPGGQPQLTTHPPLLSQWGMGSQLHLDLPLIYPALLNPYYLIRH